MRPHGMRKGFCSQLIAVGMTEARIAKAGRWLLKQAYAPYVFIAETDAVFMARAWWCAPETQGAGRDFDSEMATLLETDADARKKFLVLMEADY